MKKAIFAGIAVLLALVIFSCEGFDPAQRIVGYTDDGRPLIELSIDHTASRALTDTLARAGISFFEVAFYDGTDYYRTSWNRGRSGSIRLPPGVYGLNAEKAILFAGNRRDHTLLAVGLLTHIDGEACTKGTDASLTINLYTTRLTFTLLPLLTDVKPDPTSTFKLTDARTSTVALGDFYLNTAEYAAGGATFPRLMGGEIERPTALFLLPSGRGDVGLGSPGTTGSLVARLTNGTGAAITLVAGTVLTYTAAPYTYTYTVPGGDLTVAAIGGFEEITMTTTTVGNDTTTGGLTAGGVITISNTGDLAPSFRSYTAGTPAVAAGTRAPGVQATFSIGLPTVAIPGDSPNNFNFATDYGPGIFLGGNGTVDQTIVLTEQFPFSNTVDVLITAPRLANTAGAPATTAVNFKDLDPDGTGALVRMDIITADADYYTKIFFQIPVKAISDENDKVGVVANTWYIRGGLENLLPDEGATMQSLGGAILLGIGNVRYITINGVIHNP